MTTTWSTSALVDSVAQVLADAINGQVYAAGTTSEVTDAAPEVSPLADDFLEAGLPAVTCALGDWRPILQPGNERYGSTNPLQVLGAVWVPRVPLGANIAALYGYRDLLVDAFIGHGKLFGHVPEVQWAGLAGGPGIVARKLGQGDSTRSYLTLPFTVHVHLNRSVTAQPA
jgi:hypothetical protein